MKTRPVMRYLAEMLLICTIAWAGIWAATCLPFDKQFGYSQMLESCGRGNWIYNRIYKNKTPVDIAFIGSSRTICGVKDTLLESRLGAGSQVVNLAFCRYGRPLHYAIIKDLLSHHRPEVIVLEVNNKESRFSHPDFPFIAEKEDLIFPVTRQGYLKQLVIGAQSRLEYTFKKWLSELPVYGIPEDTLNHLNRSHPSIADPKTLKAKLNAPLKSRSFEERWVYHTSKFYLKRIARLTTNRGVQLKFLYLPSFGRHNEKPQEFDFYRQYGEVLIPSQDIFQTLEYWADGDHLNDNGALQLSQWLAGQF